MLKRNPHKPRKKKTCKVCLCEFTPERDLQPVCGPLCGFKLRNELSNRAVAVIAKDNNRPAIQKEKSRRYHEQTLQDVFNAFIRERDFYLPCPTCGMHNPAPIFGIQWDAGHYLSVGGHPELRFNEDNCHKQCRCCNSGISGKHITDQTVSQRYRVELERRIGPDRLAMLEGPQEAKHYSVEDLIALKKHYRAKTRELKRAREKNVTSVVCLEEISG